MLSKRAAIGLGVGISMATLLVAGLSGPPSRPSIPAGVPSYCGGKATERLPECGWTEQGAQQQTAHRDTAGSCSTDDLPYNQVIKSQIAELCAANFTRSDAIKYVGIYVGNGGDPTQAARIVKMGRDVEAVKRDPLLLHKEQR